MFIVDDTVNGDEVLIHTFLVEPVISVFCVFFELVFEEDEAVVLFIIKTSLYLLFKLRINNSQEKVHHQEKNKEQVKDEEEYKKGALETQKRIHETQRVSSCAVNY